LVAVADGDAVTLIDLAAGGARHVVHRHSIAASALALSIDGRIVASGGHDGEIRIAHVEYQRLLPDGNPLPRAGAWISDFARRRVPAQLVATRLGELGYGDVSTQDVAAALAAATSAQRS